MRKSQLAQLLLDAAGLNIELYDWQRNFLDDESRFRILLKSRAVGGSFLIALESFLHSLLYQNYLTLLISFSMRQSLELFRKVKDYIKKFEDVAIRHEGVVYRLTARVSETKTSVEYANGSRIISLPNNPDGIRGYRADMVYVDEAAMFKNDFEVKSAILPTLVAREGRLTLVSTPKGARGWFYEAWNSEVFSRHRVHYSMAPHIRESDLEGLRASLTPLEWEQEMELRFLDEAGALFPYNVLLDCVEDAEYGPSGAPIFIGIDFGRYRDSTVVTAVEKSEKLRVVFLEEWVGVDFNNQLARIGAIIDMLRPASVWIDKTGLGIPLYDIMVKKYPHTVGFTFTAKSKDALVKTLVNVFHNRQIVIPRSDRLIGQLRSYPSGEHDDYVMSLALAVSAALRFTGVGGVKSVWEF